MSHTFTREELVEAIEIWNEDRMSLNEIAKKFKTTKQNISQKFSALRRRGVNIRDSRIANVTDQQFINELKNKFGEIL